MTNKELVAAGHAFAKAQGADAPLTEIAKLVSDLATRLDVITVRADVLAAENMALKNYIDGECYIESKRTGVYTCAGINKPETPGTESVLNVVRAEGVNRFIEYLTQLAKEYPYAMVAKSLEVTEVNAESFIRFHLPVSEANKDGE